MYSIVKVNPALSLGDVVSYNSTAQYFDTATNHHDLIGVVNETPYTVDNQEGSYASVIFAGVCIAKASREIQREGGKLQIENGKVYIDNSVDGCGIVSPTPYDQPTKQANDLVLIHLR